MQQYFRTGKTIVIDDQYNEARPLLDALCKNQIPFFYTQGKPNSDFPLPNTDSNDANYYSLIFLDLNLDFKFAGGGIGTEGDERTFKGTHASILNTVVKNKNRSFILVIWSNEEENYKDEFLKIFTAQEKYNTSKRPYKIISLAKPDFFIRNKDGNYEFIEGKEEELKNRINTQLADLDAFKLFCEWDRVVSQSVGDTVDDFMSLINHIEIEGDREKHLAEILTSISVAYSGYDGFLKLTTDEERTDSVFLALTQIVNDDIDRNVLNERQQEFTKWKATSIEDIKKVNKAVNTCLLNRKLLIYKPTKKNLTGSVYALRRSPDDLVRVLNDCFDIGSLCKKIIEKRKVKYKKGMEDLRRKDSQSPLCLQLIYNRCIPVELNVTPLCDIVQNKFINYRVVTGFMISTDFYECIKKTDLAFFYKSPTFIHDDEEMFLGLDLRSFNSFKEKEIENKQYLYSLRTNLINDIQTKLAAHVSRLGVLYL